MKKALLASIISVALGVIAIILGFITGPARDVWLWLVIWFLVFGGAAQAVIVWAAVFRVAQARWSPAVNRLGHSAILYLPVMYIVLIILLAGVRHYVPWVWHPVPAKAAWLNIPFMAARNLIGLALLFIMNYLLVRWSLCADSKEEITEKDQYRLTTVGIAIVITYSVVFTVISYDFIMSLWPEWFSTMFGPYYFITNLYAGLAVLIIMAAALRRFLQVGNYLGVGQFRDLGNLMLGFALFSMGLFFAQYLTIWYANLPVETEFLIFRYLRGPWPVLGWSAFILGYAIPFLLLQSRIVKSSPKLLMLVAVIVLIGIVLERYVLVVPSVAIHKLLLNPIPLFGFLVFLGLFVLSVIWFLNRYEPLSAAEAAFPQLEKREMVP